MPGVSLPLHRCAENPKNPIRLRQHRSRQTAERRPACGEVKPGPGGGGVGVRSRGCFSPSATRHYLSFSSKMGLLRRVCGGRY